MLTLRDIQNKYRRGEKLAMVTCYDYASALLCDATDVDMILVGDSVANTLLGYDTTLPVTLDEMIHHAAAVQRGVRRAVTVVDMPFLSYQVSAEEALRNAGRVLKETGSPAVKLEGGQSVAATVHRLVQAGIPVMGHIGLTPQSVHALGGYRVQGRDEGSAERLMGDARALEEAGVFAIVLELVAAEVASQITAALTVPTIGIGSGPGCSGQVQVFHDLLGLFPDRHFRHAKRYAEIGTSIRDAIQAYVSDVHSGRFP